MSHPTQLLAMIDRVLVGEWDFDMFARTFYAFYVDEVPADAAMTDDEWEYFGFVQERLDYVAETPSPEDRKHGWHTPAEYLEWLQVVRPTFPRMSRDLARLPVQG